VVDSEGNFIVVGTILKSVGGGRVVARPGAAIVSKDTVPPLDAFGGETFEDPEVVPYTILRPLRLRPGSPDLDLVLHASSFGPATGAFGGGGHVPSAGDAGHNLNSWPAPCPESFPAAAQATAYSRPIFPLHQVPVWGFRGDQVAYDPATGDELVPRLGSGIACFPAGCLGEDPIDQRREAPITLQDFLRARGRVSISLSGFDAAREAHTGARFEVSFEGLLPHSVYTIWAVRQGGQGGGVHPDPLGLPNILLTDADGEARGSYAVAHPFPEAGGPDGDDRIVGLTLAFHPDYQSWGACFGRLGPGVDIVRVLDTRTPAWGRGELTSFVTVPPAP
jgi:hypothetical protein